MAPSPSSDRRRLARTGLLAATVSLALLLVGTTLWSTLGIQGHSQDLAEAQGHLLLRAVSQQLGRPPDEALLDEALADWEEEGLRWVGLVGPEGELVAEAGSARGERIPPGTEPDFQELEGRIRALAPAPGPPGPGAGREPPAWSGEGPPAPSANGLGGPPFGPGAGLPERVRLVIEYEPQLAAELGAWALRTLWVAIAGALVLISMAGWSWRAWVRADAAELDLARHRNLAALGQVSAVLAHEIRNPLAALKGHAQLLEELVEPRHQPRVERVVGEAQRLEKLTNDLLDFARTAHLERQRVDPLEPLRGAIADAMAQEVELHTEGAPPAWSLDEARLRQVLVNLLSNAMQASERVEVSVGVESGQLVYGVRDHGDGIVEGEEERIFEPFVTTRTRGTGLGLAVSRRIVQLHGGTLEAMNHADGGALFRVRIPVQES